MSVMSAILLLLGGLVMIALIIVLGGYFVAQEFSFMSVDRARLRAQADAGDKKAQQALKVTKRTSFMLSGAQLGITVTGLMVGYVAEPMVGAALGTLLGGVGISQATAIAVGTVGALVLATVVQMIFGELYPKNLALAIPEPMSKALARSTNIYLALFGWLIKFFDWSSNVLLKAVGIQPVEEPDDTATADDLERIVADSAESGDLPPELSVMLDRILDFPERDVEHAMIPRSQVGVVAPDLTVGEIRERMATEHSRYPVLGEDDQPLGVVHLADVLSDSTPASTPIGDVMREPLVVPELMRLTDALDQLKTTKNELACVIDEYGGFTGVITIEDLAEELVGEIHDEHDNDAEREINVHSDHTWTMDGDVHLDEVERAIGHDLPEMSDVETLAGLFIAEVGELPSAGETVRVDLPVDPREFVEDEQMHRQLELTVLAVDRFVPSEVRVELNEWPASEDEEHEAADREATQRESAQRESTDREAVDRDATDRAAAGRKAAEREGGVGQKDDTTEEQGDRAGDARANEAKEGDR